MSIVTAMNAVWSPIMSSGSASSPSKAAEAASRSALEGTGANLEKVIKSTARNHAVEGQNQKPAATPSSQSMSKPGRHRKA